MKTNTKKKPAMKKVATKAPRPVSRRPCRILPRVDREGEMPTQPTQDEASAVLAIVKQWVEMRMARGSLSPIVKHELGTVLQIIREECDSRGVHSP